MTTSELWHERQDQSTQGDESYWKATWNSVEVITPTKITDFFLKKDHFTKEISSSNHHLSGVNSLLVVNVFFWWIDPLERNIRWLELQILAYNIKVSNEIKLMVSNIFYFHPYLGKWSNLTNIFQMGWNHQLESSWWLLLFLPLLLLVVAVATPCFTGQKAIELIIIRDCTA